MFKGYKTAVFNAFVAAATVLLQWLGGVDWVAWVGPEWAVLGVTLVNFALRFITDTPIFKSK